MQEKTLWVGKHKRSGRLFVYDPERGEGVQSKAQVKLFDVERHKLRDYEREGMKTHLQTVSDARIRDEAIAAYERYLGLRPDENPAGESYKVCFCGKRIYKNASTRCSECGWHRCAEGHCRCKQYKPDRDNDW